VECTHSECHHLERVAEMKAEMVEILRQGSVVNSSRREVVAASKVEVGGKMAERRKGQEGAQSLRLVGDSGTCWIVVAGPEQFSGVSIVGDFLTFGR
jgi:hypothetical protein